MRFVSLRILCLLAAGFCAAAAQQISNLGLREEKLTPLALLALVGVGAAGVGFLLMVFAPSRWWLRAGGGLREWSMRARARPLPVAVWTTALIMLVALISYGLITARFLSLRSTPVQDDQIAYLIEAQRIARAGGPAALVQMLFAGTFSEANRHPLFLGMLSLVPTFGAGKVLSVTIGALTLLLLTALVALRFGALIAAVFSTLLATNFAYCYATTLVTAEGLLTLFVTLAWLMADSGRRTLSEQRATRQYGRALGVGALLGLAYLTKATALLLLAGYLFWLMFPLVQSLAANSPVTRRAAVFAAILAVLSWAVVSSPLLTRNVIRFQHPLYNINSYYLFTDEYIAPEELNVQQSVGAAASKYFETHSLGAVVNREVHGIAWEFFILCRTLGPAPLDDSRVIFGLIFLAAAVCGALVEPRRDAALVGIWTVLCVVVFAWYVPIAAGDRFVLPLVPPLLAYAAIGLVRVGQWSNRRLHPWPVALSGLWCLACVGLTFGTSMLAGRF